MCCVLVPRYEDVELFWYCWLIAVLLDVKWPIVLVRSSWVSFTTPSLLEKRWIHNRRAQEVVGVHHYLRLFTCGLTWSHLIPFQNVQVVNPIVLVRWCWVSFTTPSLPQKRWIHNRRAQEVVGVHHYLWLCWPTWCCVIGSRSKNLDWIDIKQAWRNGKTRHATDSPVL